MAYSSLIPRRFQSPARSRWGWPQPAGARLGKVDNCQVAIYFGYVLLHGHTLVDLRLYLPKAWTQDKAHLDKAGVPKACRGYRTRHQLALEMLADHGEALPHGWIAGDDEMGRPYWFRPSARRFGRALPVSRAFEHVDPGLRGSEPPESSGRGRRPKHPWQSVATWSQTRDDQAWRRMDVRDGAKGPLVVEIIKRRVASRTHRRQEGEEELLVVVQRDRERDNHRVVKMDYYLSNAAPDTPLWQCAKVAKAGNIALKNAFNADKSEGSGLADYAVRHWTGWHHHQTLSLLATWFLERETHRGKKMDPSHNVTPDSPSGIAMILREAWQCGTMSHILEERQKRLRRNELARFYYWKRHNLLAPLNLHIRRLLRC